ncbi:Rieske 2Fe-2S domain-containing protein [Deferribacteraceae bacterium V6Fe1]|nr:Rieske 2Fe-2S domain-containing protein [Deferribacteraceae bacterium V6Fe1]
MDKDKRNSAKSLLKFFSILAGVVLFYKFLLPARDTNSNVVKVKIEDVPGEGALIIPDKKIAVMRIHGKYEVFSTVCTHLGCNVAFNKEGFACPCHGSKFDISGNVLKGPATRPLGKKKFKTTQDEIIIYT